LPFVRDACLCTLNLHSVDGQAACPKKRARYEMAGEPAVPASVCPLKLLLGDYDTLLVVS
jgi:hypothetical protein